MYVSKRQLSCVLVFYICGVYVYHIEANTEVEDATLGPPQDLTQKSDLQRQSSALVEKQGSALEKKQDGALEKKAVVAVLGVVATSIGALFGGGKFITGLTQGRAQLKQLKKMNAKLDRLQRSMDMLSKKVDSLMVGQEMTRVAAMYSRDVKRIKYFVQEMTSKVKYCSSGKLKDPQEAKRWANAVVAHNNGLNEALANLNDMVLGKDRLFLKKSLVEVYKAKLPVPTISNPGTYAEKMESYVMYLLELQISGYAAFLTAKNVLGRPESEIIELQSKVKTRLEQQSSKIVAMNQIPTKWRDASVFTPPYHIAVDRVGGVVRFVDLNGDGMEDFVYFRQVNQHGQQKGAYINTGEGWERADHYIPPYHISADNIPDVGARFVDLNGDNKMDFVYHRWNKGKRVKGAYINTGSGWENAPHYAPPYHIAVDNLPDAGARFVDLNGDGKADFVYYRQNWQQKGAYINTGNGWKEANHYAPPYQISEDGLWDLGARFVDLNNDGKMDFVYHNQRQKGAYINTGSGWKKDRNYEPPYQISSDDIPDLSARFVDLNGDNKVDFVYHRYKRNNQREKGAYLNTGDGWKFAPQYTPQYHITIDSTGEAGARFVDVNGDNKTDLVFHRRLNSQYTQKGAYINTGNKNQIFSMTSEDMHLFLCTMESL